MQSKDQPSDVESPGTDDPGTDPESHAAPAPGSRSRPREIGGPKGLEPTRYGDWERKGRCIDF